MGIVIEVIEGTGSNSSAGEGHRKVIRGEVKLTEVLLSYANWNARTAWNQFQDPDLNKRLNAAACAGMATELLLKYLLARQSPGLLAELTPGEKGGALTARLTFSSEDYSKDLADVRSCTAEDAFYIHTKIDEIPTVLALDEFKTLMKVRNAACHLAAESRLSDIAEAMYSLTSMYDRAKNAISGLEWPFMGVDHFVEVFQYQYRQSSAELIKGKIKEHKEASQTGSVADSAPDDANEFLGLWSATIFDEDYSFTHPQKTPWKCPSCKSQNGALLCEIENTTFYEPAEPDREPKAWAQGEVWTPMAFGCINCGLCLTPRELRTLELAGDGWAVNASDPIPKRKGDFEEIPEEFQVTARGADPDPGFSEP
ncbi:hypothetical protein ACFVYC_20995 [Pseudarthrobacter sp. NPDC058329]|uniref:hypothetical protein n=1 Tax=Pseudarthrobacter sp. NPDC058329 TaxID=3346448 RepID=UPI0036DECDD7